MRDRRAAIRILPILAAAAALVGLQALSGIAPPAKAQEVKMPALPEAVATCAACHEAPVRTWNESPHRRTIRAPQVPKDLKGCVGCHRGAATHVQDVMVVANRPTLKNLSGDQVTDLCLNCHRGGEQAMWKGASHSRLEKSCLSCHSPHYGKGRYMLVKPEPQLCFQCHPRQQAESRLPSHHPIVEGKMVCTDCHNPHGDERGNLPEASNSELCFKCHAEKEGPFTFEHPPVTEDCTNCHKPHGSQTNNLLTQDQPLLCMRCHAGHNDGHRGVLVPFSTGAADVAEAKATIAAYYTKCTSCHNLIHGSDLPSQSGAGTFMPGALPGPTAAAEKPRRAADAATDVALWGLGGFALGTQAERGTPAYVREFDGKNYEVPAFGFDINSYSENNDTHLSAGSLAAGDEDASLYGGNGIWRYDLDFSALTHRTGRFNDPLRLFTSPRLTAAQNPGAVFPAADGGSNQVFITDLDNGKNNYEIDRQLLTANISAVSPRLPAVKWLAYLRRESEHGGQQFKFLDRCAGCHKFELTQPIDRVTTDVGLGLDLNLGRVSARYLHNERRFDNQAPEVFHNFSGQFGVLFNGTAPLFGVPDVDTRTDSARATADLRENLSGWALWRDRDRRNNSNQGTLGIQMAGGGLNWLLGRSLLASARYVSRDFDVAVPAQFNPDNLVERKRKNTSLGLRFTGLRSTTLYGEFEREVTNRTAPDYDMIPKQTRSNIWTVRGTFRPMGALTVRGDYKKVDSSRDLELTPGVTNSRNIGRPDTGKYWSALADYELRQGLLASAFASRREEEWKILSRHNDDDIKTTGLSLGWTPTERTNASVWYYKQKGDTFTNANFGTDEFTLQPQDITFTPIEGAARQNYDAAIWQAYGSHRLSPRVRLFGSYAHTNASGRETLIGLYDYLDLNPAPPSHTEVKWNPFDLRISDAWAGIGYLADPLTEFTLTYQRREWDDRLDSSQFGTLRVWRVGVQKRF